MKTLIPTIVGLVLAASGHAYANHAGFQGQYEVRTPSSANETASGSAAAGRPASESVAHRHSPESVSETGTPSNAWAPATPSNTGHVSAVPSSTNEISGVEPVRSQRAERR